MRYGDPQKFLMIQDTFVGFLSPLKRSKKGGGQLLLVYLDYHY